MLNSSLVLKHLDGCYHKSSSSGLNLFYSKDFYCTYCNTEIVCQPALHAYIYRGTQGQQSGYFHLACVKQIKPKITSGICRVSNEPCKNTLMVELPVQSKSKCKIKIQYPFIEVLLSFSQKEIWSKCLVTRNKSLINDAILAVPDEFREELLTSESYKIALNKIMRKKHKQQNPLTWDQIKNHLQSKQISFKTTFYVYNDDLGTPESGYLNLQLITRIDGRLVDLQYIIQTSKDGKTKISTSCYIPSLKEKAHELYNPIREEFKQWLETASYMADDLSMLKTNTKLLSSISIKGSKFYNMIHYKSFQMDSKNNNQDNIGLNRLTLDNMPILIRSNYLEDAILKQLIFDETDREVQQLNLENLSTLMLHPYEVIRNLATNKVKKLNKLVKNV